MVVTAMAGRRQGLQREAAESIAAQALAFLAADPGRLSRFLVLTGLGPDEIRRQLGTPELLLAVLDHLAQDEPLLLAFAADAALAPEAVGQALAVLQESSGRPARA
jgi:hypothetical protein